MKITPVEANIIMAISEVLYILAAILDSGDRIAKPTSRMVLQPLIIHKKVVFDDYLVHLHSQDLTAAILDSENFSR